MNGKFMLGQIIQKVCKTYCHNEIHISIKFSENIPNGKRVIE